MSETLKTGGEKSTENVEATSHPEVLTELRGKFDSNKAKSLAERDKPKSDEKPKTETRDRDSEYLAAMPEKQEKELSPQDAANEYLSLLDELSQDFTYPFYKNGAEHGGRQHTANHIVRDLGRKYSDNPHYRHRGYIGTEANDENNVDYTVERMGVADAILANEIGWRDEGEVAKKKAEQVNERIDKQLEDLDEDYSKKGSLGKFFGKRKYEKARKKLEQSRPSDGVDMRTHRKYNANIAKELAIAYNERGDYDYNGGDYGESQNEARNRQFFGFDDPERAKKVERAIELRRKYEAEWSKKK